MDKKDIEGYVEKLVKECGCSKTKAREMVEDIIQKAETDNDVVYVIDIDYKDGNSYGTEQTSTTIDYPWHNKRIAIENLQAINEHLDFVKRLNSYSRRSEEDLIKEFSKSGGLSRKVITEFMKVQYFLRKMMELIPFKLVHLGLGSSL